MTPDSATQIKGSSDLQVLSAPTERVSYLAFNTIKGGPTNDPRVRQAISMAIDYSSLISELEQGYAKRVNSVLTPLAVGYPTALPDYTFDKAKAKALVAQAGDTGKTIVMATSPTYDPQIVQSIQANIQDIGLKVSIQNTDQATYLKKVQSPAHDWGSIRFGQWSCSCLDADGVAYPLFRTGTIWSSYSNPQFDALVDKARQTIDTATRTKRLRPGVRDPRQGRSRHRAVPDRRDLRREHEAEVESRRPAELLRRGHETGVVRLRSAAPAVRLPRRPSGPGAHRAVRGHHRGLLRAAAVR